MLITSPVRCDYLDEEVFSLDPVASVSHAGEFSEGSCRVIMFTGANFGGNIAMGFLH